MNGLRAGPRQRTGPTVRIVARISRPGGWQDDCGRGLPGKVDRARIELARVSVPVPLTTFGGRDARSDPAGRAVTGLPWVRLDTAFPSNPKVLALLTDKEGHRTAFVYLCGLAYAGAHGTDGVITVAALPFLHARRSDADRLVQHRLWHPYPDGGWLINGWDEKQVTAEATRVRSEAAKKAAAARWHPARERAE